jgi:hypothetical protein
VKQNIGLCSTIAAILLIGCDPGLTIYQVRPASIVNSATAKINIHVRTSHPLIGETSYAPEVKITNSSGASITVTKVELAEGNAIYENKPVRAGTYPASISAGDTQVLDIWFDVKDGVGKMFHKPAELRVHYRSDNKEEIVSTTIVGGPLNTRVP